MSTRRLFAALVCAASLLAACASPTPSVPPTGTSAPTSPPTAAPPTAAATAAASALPAATAAGAPDNRLPFTHTACAAGVDLTGQTISFYHLIAQEESVDTYVTPLLAGYADATAYFNTHGGLCGATIKQVFPPASQDYDPGNAYASLLAQSPKPSLVVLYSTSDAEKLRDRLAKDQIPALGFRAGSDLALYGYDGHTPGWIYSTNPRYGDQIGSLCDYVAAHPERFPHPVLGIVGNADLPSTTAIFGPGHQYCSKLGIGDGGTATVSSNDVFNAQSALDRLIRSGANIILSFSYDEAPSSMAHVLVQMGVQTTVTLAAYSWAFDPASAWPGANDLGADGLPVINGMLGLMPARSLAETDNAGIALINAQAAASPHARNLLTNSYVKAWSTTDLLREVYVQTGNRVGYDHITGPEIKATLEKIIYAPLGGVERIDFQGGAVRALTADRIGQLGFLGADGKTLAGPGNPPKNVSVNSAVKVLMPMVVPLTDYQPGPDLRPGGPNISATPPTPTATPQSTTPITFTGQLLFGNDSDGEIYRMALDGSGKVNLTNNPAHDWGPRMSADGTKIVFNSDRDGNPEIYVMNADGSGQTRLTNNTADDGGMTWSPDGKKIFFNSSRDGNEEVYVMNADGTHATRLTNNPADDEWTVLSPDGKKIAFASDRGGNGDVYVMNADGSGVVDVTNNPANDAAPVWSPDGKQIAFGSDRDGNGEIYLMNADGSHQINLSQNAANDGDQAWSPDGKQIVFGSDRDGTSAIYVMNADGSGQTLLPNSVPLNGVAWLAGAAAGTTATDGSPASGQIVYVSSNDDNSPSAEIYIMNPDGSGQTRLTNNSFADSQPALSRDGKKIAFRSNRGGTNAIYLMNADGSAQTIVPNQVGEDEGAAWSPDGSQLVFVSSRDGNPEIYVMLAEGSRVTRLTNDPGSDYFPQFSPDGKRISYFLDSNGKGALYLMNADGSGQKLLSDASIIYGFGAWSPDGQRIAFGSDRDGNGEIYVMNADGTGQTRLTNDPGNDELPEWSPDGKRIAFDSDRSGSSQVYVMNADGSGQTQLTNDPQGAWWASWGG